MLIHVTNITRDILGYKNNTIVPSLATDVTDATLRASDLWLGIRTGAGGTATLAWRFYAAPYGSVEDRLSIHNLDFLYLHSST